ncbi:hypothetical protein F5Y16DRAFT_395111 [Xylariaceae sp. FL0255]|nr:hypothetical protein F5Y16DRAFT_395111 [Xylariaceae sp. FL0255]
MKTTTLMCVTSTSLLFNPIWAMVAPHVITKLPYYPNVTTSSSVKPSKTPDAYTCFPYADPDCCVDIAVCQCTFFEINPSYDAGSLCHPPGRHRYGHDVGSLPGFCCN